MPRLTWRKPASRTDAEIDIEGLIGGGPDTLLDAESLETAIAALRLAKRETENATASIRKAMKRKPNNSTWGTLGYTDPMAAQWEMELTALQARSAAINRAIDRLSILVKSRFVSE
jgi:hypothetical protein